MANTLSVRILTDKDSPKIEDIYHRNFDSVSKKHYLKTGSYLEKDQLYEKMTALWFSALYRYYLNPKDDQHILLGLFEESTLVAYVAIRFDLPSGYENGWVVSYLKADPDVNIIKNNGMRLLWLEMFAYSENLGKTKWYTITEKKRHEAFDAFGIKVVPEINNRYEYSTVCEIPAGTRSDIDWIFAMMGRIIHQDKDYIVRVGTLK